MSQISATLVMELRNRTGLPMMDCKKALIACDGDIDKAIDQLRSEGKGVTVKRAGKETAEGRVTTYVAGDTGVLLEICCESAPVAKTEQFIDMCNDVAKHLVKNDAESVDALLKQPIEGDAKRSVQDRLDEVVALIREKMAITRFARLSGGAVGAYAHHDGSVGVLIQVDGNTTDTQMLRDVCMHITATNPIAGTRDQVPKDILEKEQAIAIAQTREDPKMEGKPAEIIEKASQGKVNKWLAQNVLLDQPFVKDESKKVGDLLTAAGVKLKKFVRYRVGENS